MKYEIREIIKLAEKIQKNHKITWENIGDPLTAGEKLPNWLKQIVQEEAKKDQSYAYCPTKGVLETRKYLSKKRKKEKIDLDIENILFFNGLGDAISTVYSTIDKNSRIIGPDPVYPAHSIGEYTKTNKKYINYKLTPENNWSPDIKDLENKIKKYKTIIGILIINPGNPTSQTHDINSLKKIIELARKYDLFIISDEVYANLTYNKDDFTSIAQLTNEIPLIIMKGFSKEIPWPGSRCGWIEFYNPKKDKIFENFINSIVNAKMLEVCATTLPQKTLPKILEHPEYKKYTKKRIEKYKKRADIAYQFFKNNPYIIAPKPNAAFYYTIVFKKNKLNNYQKLKIKNKENKKIILKELSNTTKKDKRFIYFLIASTGIVSVPLSSFNSNNLGLRITLLQENENTFKNTIKLINNKIIEYIESHQKKELK